MLTRIRPTLSLGNFRRYVHNDSLKSVAKSRRRAMALQSIPSQSIPTQPTVSQHDAELIPALACFIAMTRPNIGIYGSTQVPTNLRPLYNFKTNYIGRMDFDGICALIIMHCVHTNAKMNSDDHLALRTAVTEFCNIISRTDDPACWLTVETHVGDVTAPPLERQMGWRCDKPVFPNEQAYRYIMNLYGPAIRILHHNDRVMQTISNDANDRRTLYRDIEGVPEHKLGRGSIVRMPTMNGPVYTDQNQREDYVSVSCVTGSMEQMKQAARVYGLNNNVFNTLNE